MLKDPDAEIPDRKFVELLELISKEDDGLVGIHMAMKLKSRNWGVFGHAVRNAPSVEAALNIMANFINVFSQAVEEKVVVTEDAIGLSYRLSISSIEHRRQDSEFSLAAIISMLREATGADIKARLVQFEHAAPGAIQEYRDFFGVVPKFKQPINTIMFSRSVLAIPMVDADPRLYALSLRYLSERLEERRVECSVIDKISYIVARKLTEGVPTLAQVASAMYMSERTLQRRCNQEGIDFLHLVDHVRHQAAVIQLRKSDRSLTDIASELGYSQLSAFSRAFRRWTGLTPKQYRDTYKEELH
ncbi:hypothetical protein N878_07860 [Pseudomonas sp. EGD-AK9]|nr:hypothetical protein N878_07860 [Pseudomonas sp. EGD-AK9]